jgi:Protein of unknown function (DUF3309)
VGQAGSYHFGSAVSRLMTTTGSRVVTCPMLLLILAVILVIALIGSVPAWPHSRHWGYYPSGSVGLLLVVLLILYFL